jgi:hypothetical protein
MKTETRIGDDAARVLAIAEQLDAIGLALERVLARVPVSARQFGGDDNRALVSLEEAREHLWSLARDCAMVARRQGLQPVRNAG